MTSKHTLIDFEVSHGQPRIKRMEQELAIERKKVSELSGTKDKVHILPVSERNTIRFALFGDTQFGNLYSCPEHLEAFFKTAQQEGCEVALHTGDVLDGWKVYKGQEFELRDVGFEAQINRLKEVAPCNLPVKFITGNHDASFKNLAGISVGTAIEKAVKGWTFIGEDQGFVDLLTASGKVYSVGLYHMGGGTAYAVSYRVQKSIEQMEGGRKPNMGAYGHFHKADLMPSYRNVVGIQTGCFEWQTPFMQRLPTAAHVGGWIMKITPGEQYNRIQAEFIAFYRDRK